jgi:hypothetical protein
MTGFHKALRLIGLLASALVFGLTLTHVLQSPGNRGLDGPTWLAVQHTFYGGFAIVGGISEVVGVVATTADAVTSRRRPRAAVAPAFAAVCLLGCSVTTSGTARSTARSPVGQRQRCPPAGTPTGRSGRPRTRCGAAERPGLACPAGRDDLDAPGRAQEGVVGRRRAGR